MGFYALVQGSVGSEGLRSTAFNPSWHAPKYTQKIFPSTIAQPGAILVHPAAERIRYTHHGSEQKPKIR